MVHLDFCASKVVSGNPGAEVPRQINCILPLQSRSFRVFVQEFRDELIADERGKICVTNGSKLSHRHVIVHILELIFFLVVASINVFAHHVFSFDLVDCVLLVGDQKAVDLSLGFSAVHRFF